MSTNYSDTGLSFDMCEAKKFLDALSDGDCGNKIFTFQTFSDGKRDHTLAKTWSDALSQETAGNLERLNKIGAGVFVTVNKTDGRGRRKQNVTGVRAPFVDLDGSPIDPVRVWRLKPYIIIESSPNKYHVYWRHDGSIKLKGFKQLQLKLAAKFNGDTSVHDLPRVMRLPGTWHQKNKDAPFRTRIVSIDDSAPAYSLGDFERALIDVEVPQHMFAKPRGGRKSKQECRSAREWLNQEALHHIEAWAPQFFPCGYIGSQGEWRVPADELGRPHCVEALSIHCDGIKDWATGWPDREADKYTAIGLLKAFFTEGPNGQPEMVEEFDEYGAPLGGLLSTDRAAELLAKALGEDWVALVKEFSERRTEGFEHVAGEGDADGADEVRAPAFSDEALAIRFAAEHIEKLRYVAAWSKWYVWNGKQWRADDTKLAFNMVRKECRKAAHGCNKDNVAKALASAKTVAAVERLATADQRLAATTDQWDADPWLLNTPGGAIDLRTGEIRAHRPDGYMTKIAAVEPGGACPLWRRSLERVFAGDRELIAYVQRIAGYTLTGSTREHAMFFGFGTGANGKSVVH